MRSTFTNPTEQKRVLQASRGGKARIGVIVIPMLNNGLHQRNSKWSFSCSAVDSEVKTAPRRRRRKRTNERLVFSLPS